MLEPEKKPKKSKKKEKRKPQSEGESKDADIEESIMSKKGANSSCKILEYVHT